MSDPHFLHGVCDFLLCYSGCSNKDAMMTVNSIFIWIWVSLLVMGSVFPIERIYYFWSTGSQKRLFNIHMTISCLANLSICANIASLLNSRLTSITNLSSQDLQSITTRIIVLELAYVFMCGVTQFTYSEWVVSSFSRESATARWHLLVSKAVHVFILAAIVVSFVCFATIGVSNSLADFVLWRRISFATLVLSDGIIEPVLLYFAGSRIITHLLNQDKKEEESKMTAIKKKIERLKSGTNGMILTYVLGSISFASVVFGNELFATNPIALLITKIIFHFVSILPTAISGFQYCMPVVIRLTRRSIRAGSSLQQEIHDTSQSRITKKLSLAETVRIK
ncbi:hypothetical protein HDV03_002236 [Kappamyces sp. JEL0829]|nr:hypothetical protein HDV03_002236 [Kappamyces sp. JEL0829]